MTGFLSGSLNAAAGDVKVIKVAYPSQKGLTMVDEKGDFVGYTYDYLMEIAKYTGWRYEFVTLTGDGNEQAFSALNMLESGEVDLLGGLNYSEELAETIAYSGYAYGTNYMGLYVPYESPLSESSLYTTKSIRVGVYRKNLQTNPKLEQFAQTNNLMIEQIVVDSADKLEELVANNKVDAILSADLTNDLHFEMRAIAHFSPTPFYLATTLGNSDVVRQLDYAIASIEKNNPNFVLKLYEKYFDVKSSKFHMTGEEKQYIQELGVQQVALYGNRPPFSYIDKRTGKKMGILVEMFDEISKTTGIQFELNMVETTKEYIELVKSGTIDISGDMLINSGESIDVNIMMTVPWNIQSVSMVVKIGEGKKDNEVVTIPYYLKDSIHVEGPVVYYDTAGQCLEAIQRGNAKYAYIGDFCSQYMLNSVTYNNLEVRNQLDSITNQLSFGVIEKDDFRMLTILNRWISSFSREALDEIIYRNIYMPQEISFFVWVQRNLKIVIPVSIIFILGIYILIKGAKQKRISFENQRYNTISNLSNEFFFDYDKLKDELILPEKCAAYFSCDMRIRQFSQTLYEMSDDHRTGIWQIGTAIVENKEESREVSCEMPNGSIQWFRLFCSSVHERSKYSRIIGKIVNIQDIKNEQIQLEQKAFTDGLTGIYNARAAKSFIQERLETVDAEKANGFIILDIDDFKQINDRFGHYSGDVLLIQIAGLLSEIFHPYLVGRIGGDEFIIFVENASKEDLANRCQKLADAAAMRSKELFDKKVTLSIGIAIAVANEPISYEILYQQADAALYQRKTHNKNGYQFYKG